MATGLAPVRGLNLRQIQTLAGDTFHSRLAPRTTVSTDPKNKARCEQNADKNKNNDPVVLHIEQV